MTDEYDAVLVDCPPSLGILTINGLTAAEAVVIPVQCEALSHRGVGQLLETIDDVRHFANQRLRVLGVIPTLFDVRTTHARKMLAEVEERYGLPLFEPPVPKSVRFAEAPALGQSVLQHAPLSPGAVAYRALSSSLYDAMQESLSAVPARGASGPARQAGIVLGAWSRGPMVSPEPFRLVRAARPPFRCPTASRPTLFGCVPGTDATTSASADRPVAGRGTVRVQCQRCGQASTRSVCSTCSSPSCPWGSGCHAVDSIAA